MHELTEQEADLVSGATVIEVAEFDRIPFRFHVIKLGPIHDAVGGMPAPGFGIGYGGAAFSSHEGGSFRTAGTGDLRGGS